MEHDRAIRAAEDQLRTKLFSFCRSTTPSANPCRFCRSKTTPDLHILQLLKLPRNQWFAEKLHLSLLVSADPQMGGRRGTRILTRVLYCISFSFKRLCKSSTHKPTVFSRLRKYEGEGAPPRLTSLCSPRTLYFRASAGAYNSSYPRSVRNIDAPSR